MSSSSNNNNHNNNNDASTINGKEINAAAADTTYSSSSSSHKFHYEFGGPIGTGINIVLLPWIVVLLGYYSHIGSCMTDQYQWISIVLPLSSSSSSSTTTVTSSSISSSSISSSSISSSSSSTFLLLEKILFCLGIVIGWLMLQILLERCLPATIVTGTPIVFHPHHPSPPKTSTTTATTTTTTTLQYRINGHLALWFTLLLFLHGWPTWTTMENAHDDDTTIATTTTKTTILQFTTFPYWSWLYHNFIELALATSLFCYIGSIYLYLHSFRHDAVIVAPGGNSGNVIYDYFMGRELNPRPTSFFSSSSSTATTSLWMPHFDIKEFCELRPGLLAWLLFNISCAYEQYHVLGYNTGSMIWIQIFHFIYVWDALYQESAILSTMDITTDGFGFMLLFGDLCWVPFTYSLQARYLVHHDPHLTFVQLAIIVLIHLMGYTIFRNANSQKDQFRRDPKHPSVAHLSYIETKRGTKLLTSGYWGMARKINYTGDYIMGVSWCLLCGFGSIVPYFYAIYFFILLVHRSERDDHLCREKYGDDWIKYKKIVPYRFVPGIF